MENAGDNWTQAHSPRPTPEQIAKYCGWRMSYYIAIGNMTTQEIDDAVRAGSLVPGTMPIGAAGAERHAKTQTEEPKRSSRELS